LAGGLSKAAARAQGRAVRAGMSVRERSEASQRIVTRCRAELSWARYRRVQVFLPIAQLGEVDTWGLVKWILEVWPETELFVPRLVAGRMVQVAISRKTRFRESVLGIPEPVDGRVAAEDVQFDLVLAPLLAFDRAGQRVGYGGGYYDRLLTGQTTAERVGLGFEASLVAEGIESEAHDVRLGVVVTEGEVYKFA
jgi:5-formyltetrahydrofolate cyclo-ligase